MSIRLFEQMAPLVAPTPGGGFGRRDLCILATRVVIEAAAYFGVEAEPLAVKAIIYNQTFARHVADNFAGLEDRNKPSTWGDGSWSCRHRLRFARNGRQVGRPLDRSSRRLLRRLRHPAGRAVAAQHRHRPALVGPYAGQETWSGINDTGTVIEYSRIASDVWRKAPDWKDAARRRPLVAKLIRSLREVEVRA